MNQDELQHLSGEDLMAIVRALADDIGPRPAGKAAEAQARAYLRDQLAELGDGVTKTETVPFKAWDTWGWSVIPAVALGLFTNLLGMFREVRPLAALIGSGAVVELYNGITSRQQALQFLYPKGDSGTVLARIAPTGEVRRKVVLIGHTDSNKHRPTFSKEQKRMLLPSGMLLSAAMITNALTLVTRSVWDSVWLRRLQMGVTAVLGYAMFTFLRDETGGYVDGANDNASAVACTLGIGRQAVASPFEHTEVWLAFTGAEEVGLLGTHALLDQYGDALRDAYFIDFELVGTGDIAYVTHHTGFSIGTGYTPDADSLRVAAQAAAEYPELGVSGQHVVINEEVRALRQRGYRGICLVGLDEKGWLTNWHRYSDNSSNIKPDCLATAAKFAWAMIEGIDAEVK